MAAKVMATNQPLPGMAISIQQVAKATRHDHGLRCPKCGAPEVNPVTPDTILIRGYKVDNYSQCLVCAGFYNPNDLSDYDNDRGDKAKGWFR